MGIAKTSINNCVCEGERLIFKFLLFFIGLLGKQEILNMLYTSVTRETHELLLAAFEENQYSRKAVELLGMWEA